MMGFFAALIVVGGLGSLVAIADPSEAKWAPYTLAMLFAGSGVYVFGFGLVLAGEQLFGRAMADVLVLGGLLLGGLGGAIVGFVIGSRRNQRLKY